MNLHSNLFHLLEDFIFSTDEWMPDCGICWLRAGDWPGIEGMHCSWKLHPVFRSVLKGSHACPKWTFIMAVQYIQLVGRISFACLFKQTCRNDGGPLWSPKASSLFAIYKYNLLLYKIYCNYLAMSSEFPSCYINLCFFLSFSKFISWYIYRTFCHTKVMRFYTLCSDFYSLCFVFNLLHVNV